MTDYSQLVKRLRITPAVSNETLAARIAMDEAADAIDALQARVAELEAGLASAADDLAWTARNMRGFCPDSRINAALIASVSARALLERNA